MGKELKEKYPSQEEEDLKIKTPEELEEAKKEAGVSSHREVLQRFGEIRKEEKKNKKEMTEKDWERDYKEADNLIEVLLEEKGELDKFHTEASKKHPGNWSSDEEWATTWNKRLKNHGYFLDLLKEAGREDLIEGYSRGIAGPASLAFDYFRRVKEREKKRSERIESLKKDLKYVSFISDEKEHEIKKKLKEL